MRLVLAAAILVGTLGPAGAADYWVKNGGSDGADGLSMATAWATLGHAAGVVNAGDTVHVLDGSYQGFYLDRSGSPGSPITFHAEGPNVQITADNGTTPDGINVEGAAYVVLDGFVANGRTRAGIRVAVSQFVTVRNCRTGNNGRWGIFSGFADDLTIEDNETYGSVLEHGIYVSNTCTRPIVRRNHVHDNHGNGIHMNGDLSQGGAGIITNALVERNVIHGNGVGGGSGINMDGAQNGVIRNNLLYDNHASGISLYQIDAAAGASGNLVVNNTIVQAADGRWAVNISGGSTGNTIRNNILYNLQSFRGAISIDDSSRSGFASDYNAVISRFSTDQGDTVISLGEWQALGYDAHSFVATPAQLFAVPGTDFHLAPASPALDAGTTTGAPGDDLDGNPRPVGAGIDVGAYETQLLHCADGNVDPGEQCGEPGLSCSDPCRTCIGCTCALAAPVCGDALVCGSEQCESSAQCSAGQVCQSCQCANQAVCASGIVITRAKLKLRASPFAGRLRGDVLIPKPWLGVDPPVNGVRIVVDAGTGGGGFDATIPGGAGWRTNGSATRWTFTDKAGSIAHVTKVIVRDRSKVQPGMLRVAVTARGGTLALPDVQQVRTTFVLGAPGECGALAWNPPAGQRPRCEGDAAKLGCR